MLSIDTTTMRISLTRGDTASIVFSAVQDDGTAWHPSTGDKLKFSVAKKVGAEPMFDVETEYDGVSEDVFWTIYISTEKWLDDNGNDKFKFGDYVYDVQIITAGGDVETIIGKTDTITPVFRVWGEVATEG